MKKLIKWVFAALIACVILLPKTTVYASEPTNIYFYEDLVKMAENTDGEYILMNDIDCAGQPDWVPIDFSGTFDGNGHALLNLSITGVSDGVRTTYDGNMKTYDTVFAGLFGCLENATVKNLTLLGVNVDVSIDKDCFVGTIAGYCDNSTIDNCYIKGQASLEVTGAMFGVGGVVGFGNGAILNTTAITTLVNVDLDATTRDEQFMGGAYGAGYLDLDNDHIEISGFISDHGYVHSGGLVGMYALYPVGTEYAGYITNTHSGGKITFFEDNTNRRAYCSEICGEVLHWTYAFSGCTAAFQRDERFEYGTNLYPHGDCGHELDQRAVFESDCENFGYTEMSCTACGYKEDFEYQLKEHDLDFAEEIVEPTTTSEGIEMHKCKNCGADVYLLTPPIPEEEIEPVQLPDDLYDEPEIDTQSENDKLGTVSNVLLFLLIAVAVGAVVTVIIVANNSRKRRRNRGRRH